MININIQKNNNNIVYCPKCGKGFMVERNGKWGIFYACNRYPDCKNSMKPIVHQQIVNNQNKPLKTIDGTTEQLNIWEWVKDAKKGQNLLVQARPGTGKTTTIEHSLPYIPDGKRIVYIVFNTKNAKEAQLKMSHKALVKTSHSFSRSILDDWMRLKTTEQGEQYKGLGQLSYSKSYNHITKVLKSDGEAVFYKKRLWAVQPIQQIIELLRNRLEEPTTKNIAEIIETYNQIKISTIGKNAWRFDFLVEYIPECFNKIVNDFSEFDFTDFLHLPLYHNMFEDVEFNPVDYGLFDEVQDFNKCQLELTKKILGNTGIGVFVGDDKQAIYGFRAAMNSSMDIIKKDFNCDTLPLTTTFRSPLTGIKLVNRLFPAIKFNGLPSLEREGSVNYKNPDCILDAPTGSLIMCRNNAPLIPYVLDLLAIGRKAVIIGKNIGTGLKKLIKQTKNEGLTLVLYEINTKITEEIEELEKENKKSKIEDLQDKLLVINALSNGLTSKQELLDRIDKIFSEEEGELNFTSIHRAKGLEAKDVYLVEPELLPSKNATKLWEITQEENLKLIAITRHKQNLTFVSEQSYGWWSTGNFLTDNVDGVYDDYGNINDYTFDDYTYDIPFGDEYDTNTN